MIDNCDCIECLIDSSEDDGGCDICGAYANCQHGDRA